MTQGITIAEGLNYEGRTGVGVDFVPTTVPENPTNEQCKNVFTVEGFANHDDKDKFVGLYLAYCLEYKTSRGLKRIHSYSDLAKKFIASNDYQGLQVLK